MGVKGAIRSWLGIEQRSIPSMGQPVSNSFTSLQTLLNQTWLQPNKSNVTVTPETALTVSALYSAVRNISEDIAKIPFKVSLNKQDGNRYPLYSNPAYKLIALSPSPLSTPFTFLETIIKSALLRGNGYAWIERDDNGKPINIYWLWDEAVTPIIFNRKLFYQVNDTRLGLNGTFNSEDIFHIRGMGDGYIGKSLIVYASESIGKAIATQQFGAKFFGSAGLNLIVKFLGAKNEADARQRKEAIMRTYAEDGVAAVNGDVTIDKIQVPNNEAQFIESQDFNVSDMARWLRMPLSKLQKDASTGSEQEAINYVNDCLYPWACRIQQEAKNKLFTETEKITCDATFNFDALLKGDSAAQERRVKTMFMTGAWSPNDIRKFMDYNSVDEDAMKERYLPVNMIPSSQAEEFWKGKQADLNTLSTASPDGSGSGNVNANINGK